MQEKLFYEDEYEALGLMISASGKTFKEVAQFLFPHMKYESAYARLKACVDANKDERLAFGQILAAMKFCERYDPLIFLCDETLHIRPERKSFEDQEANVVRVIDEASTTLNKALQTLDRMRNQHDQAALKVVGRK